MIKPRDKEKLLKEACAILHCESDALPSVIKNFQKEIHEAKIQIKNLK